MIACTVYASRVQNTEALVEPKSTVRLALQRGNQIPRVVLVRVLDLARDENTRKLTLGVRLCFADGS